MLVAAVMTSAICSIASPAPRAFAAPRVPCGELDQIRESLDDDITAGIDGVRRAITTPFSRGASGALGHWEPNPRQQDADGQLAMVDHGVRYLQDINSGNPIPGLAALLGNLQHASDDMNASVNSLFYTANMWVGDEYWSNYPMSKAPDSSTWAAIDNAEQKKNDIYGPVNALRGNCAP
ncbi:hypothetical protein A5673_07135 [Mycobacterium sp. E3198]|nr:hypothetical protein A5673_07135 [Mycobacterium sp. E3198]